MGIKSTRDFSEVKIMLKLTEGGLSSTAREEIKKEIFRLTEEKKCAFLIVPEQKTVTAEKEMCDFLPSYAPLYFEVTNFTRLANAVFRSIGKIAGEYSTKAKDALIMWRTLSELSPYLNIMSTSKEVNTGLVLKALMATAEMKSAGAVPSEIAEILNTGSLKSDKLLSNKLEDISKIMSLYKTLHDEKYSDVGDDLETLAGVLEEHPGFFGDSAFFVEGFTSFTEPQYKLLGILMKNTDVNILLPISKRCRDFFEYTEIRDTEERILSLADKGGVKKSLVRPDSRDESQNPVISEVGDLLWQRFGKADGENVESFKDAIRIFEAEDPYEEADFICQDIKRRVMAGERYRDFAVVMRDGEMYGGIIDEAFSNSGIPYFMSKSKELFTFEEIKLIYAAYAVIGSDFAREDVISYIKCGFTGLSREACDEFELYVEKWQINGKRFTDGILWNMNPNGFSSRVSEDMGEKLLSINASREKITEPLLRFKAALSTAKTVKEHARVLTEFLCDINLYEQIEKRRAELTALGENEKADERGEIWRVIVESLDTIAEALDDSEADRESFASRLRVVHSFMKIGKIPTRYDEVTLGSADMLRLSEKKHIYLMGVNSGEFPRAVKSNSYFSEKELSALSRAGVISLQNEDIPYARELFSFTRAFLSAREDITLIYTTRDASFTACEPENIIKRIGEITGGAVMPVRISSLSAYERIYSPSSALLLSGDGNEGEIIKSALCDFGYSEELENASKNIRNEALRLGDSVLERVYPRDLALTQTRIDTYVNCPLSYYLKYNLRLSENEKAEFDARNIGTFIHAILENFFKEVREKKIPISEIDEDGKRALVERSAKEYLDSVISDTGMGGKREEVLLKRLCRSALPVVSGLCDELSDCKFLPQYFELKIGGHDPKSPEAAKFSFDDGNVFVYGSIDRVDTYQSDSGDVFVRVIDYKTGSKSFSPDDLLDGKNLQMFLYLRSVVESENGEFKEELGLKEGGKLIPAGVIYVKTDMSDVVIGHSDGAAADEAIQKKQERRGMILNDEESLSAMNTKFIPVKFKKNGEPDSRSEKFLYTREGWDEITKTISDTVGKISKQMRSGDISTPKGSDASACSYCKFKPFCRSKLK